MQRTSLLCAACSSLGQVYLTANSCSAPVHQLCIHNLLNWQHQPKTERKDGGRHTASTQTAIQCQKYHTSLTQPGTAVCAARQCSDNHDNGVWSQHRVPLS